MPFWFKLYIEVIILDIGAKIRAYRKQIPLTMKELGRLIGISEQAISQYELGKRTPSLEILVKLSKVFNISYAELIKDTGIEKDQFLDEWLGRHDELRDEIEKKEKKDATEYEDLYSKIQRLIAKLGYTLESDDGCNAIDEELITIKDTDEEDILTIEKSVLISTGENIFKLINERVTELEEYAAFKLIKELENK